MADAGLERDGVGWVPTHPFGVVGYHPAYAVRPDRRDEPRPTGAAMEPAVGCAFMRTDAVTDEWCALMRTLRLLAYPVNFELH